MSRATILLVVILLVIVGALLWLSHRSGEQPLHHVEKAVTLNGAQNANP
jgi:hypothetical protein